MAKQTKVPSLFKIKAKLIASQISRQENIGGEYSAGRQILQQSVNELRDLADKLEAFLKREEGGDV